MQSSIEQEKLKVLMIIVAEKFIGKTVLVYLRHPVYLNAAGNAYFSKSVATIDVLMEGRSTHEIFHDFLHEIAHFVLGHVPEISRSSEFEKEFWENGPFLKISDEEIKSHEIDPDELAAESFAYQIDRITTDRAMSLFGTDDIEVKLKVLINMNLR